jgi:hypothetical protein
MPSSLFRSILLTKKLLYEKFDLLVYLSNQYLPNQASIQKITLSNIPSGPSNL